MSIFENASILVTGGTGSFGKKFIQTLLEKHNPARVVIYSRDELKQYEMQISPIFQKAHKENKLRFFIGDVRDKERLQLAMNGVDIVIHAAALKQVPACEYNPFEAVKTNIIGGQNVIDAALANKVQRVVALSTDKAAAPINLYGATKLASDKLFIAANNYRGHNPTRFSVVRYGNVMGSRGSVIPFFEEQKKQGFLTITDERMTRFNITLEEGVQFVLNAAEKMWGGELFVPKIPSYHIVDVAKAIAPDCELKIIGIRPGEKIHEEMITEDDAMHTIEFEEEFVILPSFVPEWDIEEFRLKSHAQPGKMCAFEFSYNSGSNPHFLSVQELSQLIDELKK